MGQNKLAQKEASSYIGLSAILSFEFKMHGQPASGIFSESCQIKKKKEFPGEWTVIAQISFLDATVSYKLP